ncbi:hypothetical protein [Pseudophaeobacter sp.]|uniref:hypothetical protein n=1 Tax=Pseudophaeobacter sp. TaxID=1971739 RepID=UPI00263406A9|nr:hypothetical protein [Pseudophaeobacter sp.]
MAGKRHHHIWQMLQKGFSWVDHGENQVWVYKKGFPPKQTVTRKFGRVNGFYGPEGSDADTNITEFENSTQSFIQDIRKMDEGVEIDRDISAVIVSHLEMRSNFFREEISRVGERMAVKLRECLLSPERSSSLLESYIKCHPELLDEALKSAGVPTDQFDLYRSFASTMLPKLIENGAEEMSGLALKLFDPMIESMAETAKNAHNKSLINNFHDVERANGHKSMRFFVYRDVEGKLILPDTSLAFFTKNGCTPISQKTDELEGVVVPVSRHVAIIGKASTDFQRSPETVRRVLSSCAYRSFLAAENSDYFSKLSNKISKNAQLLSDADLDKALDFKALFDI